jgi:hypothetical protein
VGKVALVKTEVGADRIPRHACVLRRRRPCGVCKHPERVQIEALHVAGVSLDKLAVRFGLKRDQIWRHATRHMTDQQKANYLAGPSRIAELAIVAGEESESTLDYLKILRSTLFGMIDRRAIAGDHQGVSMLTSRAIDVLELIAKATGQISNLAGATVNITNNSVAIMQSPAFLALQDGLLGIARRHPDVRSEIIRLFRNLDGEYSGHSNLDEPIRMIEPNRAAIPEGGK